MQCKYILLVSKISNIADCVNSNIIILKTYKILIIKQHNKKIKTIK